MKAVGVATNKITGTSSADDIATLAGSTVTADNGHSDCKLVTSFTACGAAAGMAMCSEGSWPHPERRNEGRVDQTRRWLHRHLRPVTSERLRRPINTA
jgi:hypothetical protein